MDTIVRLSIILLVTGGSLLMCGKNNTSGKDVSPEHMDVVYRELFHKLKADRGVYDIRKADRFGDQVVAVFCVSPEDRGRLVDSIPDPYKGVPLYFSSPIWNLGGILPEKGDTIQALREKREYNVVGTKENDILRAKQNELAEEEMRIWHSWSDSAKKEFLDYWIKKERQRIPTYANCGDKFLLD